MKEKLVKTDFKREAKRLKMHGTTEHFGIRLLTEGQFGQIFITDTHETRIAEQFGVDYRRFFVEGGKVSEVEG